MSVAGLSLVDLVRLLVADIALIVGIAFVAGALAPWIPASFLRRNILPLLPGETPSLYWHLGVHHLAERLPEWGAALGGRSKRELPGMDVASLRAYLGEVRRAEIVHLVSCLSWIALVPFNPWWLWAAFAVVVIAVNAPFLAVLRHNQARLERVLGRRSS